MAAVTIFSDFGAQENKICHCFYCFPIWHEVMGLDAMILVFWMLSFKPTFSLSSFTFINMLFSSSSLSAIRVVSSAYLRLLIFLPAILIPACASSSPAFLMMYSAYKFIQLCSIPCDPMDCSPPGSSVHWILQARILEWVAMPSSRGSFQPRDLTRVSCASCTAGRFFTLWGTREAKTEPCGDAKDRTWDLMHAKHAL